MSYPTSSDIQLTSEQSKVLSKLKAYANYASILPRLDFFIPRGRQIALFDYMKAVFTSIGKRNVFENILEQFLLTLFSFGSNILERKTMEGLAASFDKQKIVLSKQKDLGGRYIYSLDNGLNPSNLDFLNREVLPFFQLSKDVILAEIMALIFGPPSNIKKFNPTLTDEQAAEYAACGSSLYTISNLPNQGVGDIEAKRANLLKQIKRGGISFDISCQEVIIKLPDNYIQTFFGGNVNLNSPNPNFNPSVTFQRLQNYVETEVARQNIPENQTSAAKSFRENFIERLLNLITFSIINQLGIVYTRIYSKTTPVQNLIAQDITNVLSNQINGILPTERLVPQLELEQFISTNPCQVYNVGIRIKNGENVGEDNKYMIFAQILINAILGILISLILQKLLKEVKLLIKNVIAKKSKDLAERISKKRLAMYEAFFNRAKSETERKAKLVRALDRLSNILRNTQ
jgi:hypothetical protein